MNEDIQISKKEIEKFREIGILDETRLLYLKIRTEFENKAKNNPEMTKTEIIKKLADKYMLGIEAITKICYKTIKQKKKRLFVVSEL